MDRPTVHDLARHANVSLATVDRVLNGRPGVREQTVARVRKAIDDLGYSRDANAATLARKKPYRFVFLLPKSSTRFMANLIHAIQETARSGMAARTVLDVVQAPMVTPHDVSGALGKLDRLEMDGLAIMAPETPTVRDAVIKLREAGVEVVPIISDLPGAGCGHFVGIDNLAAGRTAAGLLGRFCAPSGGDMLVVGGFVNARDGIERRLGFDQVMRAQFPDFHVRPTAEGRDIAERVEQIVLRALRTDNPVAGIYLAGAGTSGLVRALRQAADAPTGLHGLSRPFVIAHELTAVTRDALRDGLIDAVISQDVGHIARSTLRVLRAQKDQLPISATQERIRIDIFTTENMPSPKGQKTGGPDI
ncbi:MAG: LacI family DNA-binding transcriptional regulator [Pseudomonadota bacterium]